MTAIRTLHQTLAIAAAGLALLAAAAGTPSPRDAEPFARAGADAEAAASTPRVVGARLLPVPSAEPADFARLDSLAAQRDQTLVLYSDDDVRDTQAWANLAALGHDRAYVLSGGMDAWTEEVMEAALRGDSADYVAALSRYFGGAPRREDAHPMSAAPPSPRVRADGERRETDAFGEPVRRGC